MIMADQLKMKSGQKPQLALVAQRSAWLLIHDYYLKPDLAKKALRST
jgi:hypothetical protein